MTIIDDLVGKLNPTNSITPEDATSESLSTIRALSLNDDETALCDSSPHTTVPQRRPSILEKVLSLRRSTSPATNNGVASTIPELPPLPPITLRGVKPSTKRRLLDNSLACEIRNILPPRLQLYREWDMVYSMDQDGISLQTLYRLCDPDTQLQQLRKSHQEHGFAELVVSGMIVSHSGRSHGRRHHGYVMIIMDEHKHRFGCFLNEHPKTSNSKRYYGNGDCFLWKCEKYTPHEFLASGDSLPASEKESERFKAFMSTGLNSNFIYSNADFISIGASEGNNGLWVDRSLENGVSCKCDTFGNEVLCELGLSSNCTKFKIMGLEVWRIGQLKDQSH